MDTSLLPLGLPAATAGRGQPEQRVCYAWCLTAYSLLSRCHPLCRPDYMTTFVDKLIDWDNVAKRFEAATS